MAIDTNAIEELKLSLKASTVVTPESENYQESLHRWAASAEKPARVIVFATTAEDVSTTVLFSKKYGVELAVVGGGHATSGSSSTDGGVCIDLSKMRGVTVDPVAKTITAQGGTIWEDVDKAAAKHGLATVGGTVNHTGVGGLTLGGGYGWLTGSYGLTIDNLLSVEMVLADGSIVTASDVENQDLFWAARGAGASFGVATTFVFKGYEQKNAVWGGLLALPPTKLPEVVDFANHLLKVSNGKSAMVFGFGAPPPADKPVILTVLFFNGPEAEATKLFAPLLNAGPLLNKTSTLPYSEVNAMLNSVSTHGDRKSQKGTAFLPPMDPRFAVSIFDDYKAFLERVPNASRTVVLFECFKPEKLLEVAQTEMSFANRGEYGNILLGMRWKSAEFDSVCREWARTMARKINSELDRNMKRKNLDKTTKEGVGEYGNYDGFGASANKLFGVNYDRLVDLKTRYDPENVFFKSVALVPRTPNIAVNGTANGLNI